MSTGQELCRHPFLNRCPGAWAQLGDVHDPPLPAATLRPAPLHQQAGPRLDAVDGYRDPAVPTWVRRRTVRSGGRRIACPDAVAQRNACPPAISTTRHVTTLEHLFETW